jgi:hypothetical protein
VKWSRCSNIDASFKRLNLQKSRIATMIVLARCARCKKMAECQKCSESGQSRNVYPALAIAALAGVAFTYFLVRRGKSEAETMPVEKVVNLCNSAADKLDAFMSQALAG